MNYLKENQQKIALVLGFAAVAALGFFGGKNLNRPADTKPAVSASSINTNYTTPATNIQTTFPLVAAATLDCKGKIKGSSSHKYHLPGGAFYKKTTHPIACFDTEAQATAAGFTKSSR
jgi:micrococcal nuclease